jgi:F-type H+-transporting ATPase subunit delta
MLNSALARRYARALFELAVESAVLEVTESELKEIVALLGAQKDLQYLLNHPGVETTEKREVLEKIFAKEVSLLTQHFIYLLLDRRRQDILPLVQREFSKLADEKNKVVEATVTSVVPLTGEQEKKLSRAVQIITGKSVRLLKRTNEALIGGAQIKIGDSVMDGSIAYGLRKMRQELLY